MLIDTRIQYLNPENTDFKEQINRALSNVQLNQWDPLAGGKKKRYLQLNHLHQKLSIWPISSPEKPVSSYFLIFFFF